MATSTDPQIYRQSFSDNIDILIGDPKAPVLMKMFSKETKKGDSVRIDGLKANDAVVVNTYDIESRRDHADLTDFAAWKAIQTPYTGVVKQGSFVSSKTIKAVDVIGSSEDLLRIIDVKSPTMVSLAQSIYKQEDLLAVTAALAPSVLRELNRDGTQATVSMPSSQEYETENVGYIGPNDLSNIDAIFRDEYVNAEKYVVVNPVTAAAMKNNNRDYFQSVDFIGRMGALNDGIIEMAEGFHVLVVPQVPTGVFFAFCKQAITCNIWRNQTSRVSELPTQNYDVQLYSELALNAVRNDDLGVVHGTIKVS